MIIEKDLIRSAKQKIGDSNFDLIMDGLLHLGLVSEDDIDRRNLRCRCPFHAGDMNPSFSYDRKNYRMHCFGCQKDYDAIDVFKDSGMTYLEAVQELFRWADIQYAFSEKHIKIQPREYRYPTEISKENDRTAVVEYWKKRGISEQTLDYADVRADEKGNSVFSTYDLNDVLTVVKYKPSHKITKGSGEPKCWFQKDADAADLLWNMNKINTTEPLLICEGEPDALTAMEAGYKNVVTPLKGSGSFAWVEHTWDFLEQFDSIVICSDNDPAGYKMRDELVFRLGSWRCKTVSIPATITWTDGKEYPCNDLNDYLLTCGKDAVLSAIVNATDTPVKSVTDFSDITDLELSEMDGVETGLDSIDNELYKLYYGTLTIISGRPGAGKSSLINAILANAIQNGVVSWLFSKEMPGYIVRNWINLQLAGPRNVEKKVDQKGHVYYNIKPNVKQKINDWARGRLFLYNDGEPNDADSLFASMEETVRKFGVHLLILDNLMCIQLSSPDGELKAQTDFIARLINFAIKYRVAVILVAHPRKKQAGEPTNADLTMDDVAGSANIVNLAHRSIALRRITQKEQEDSSNKYSNYNVKVTITKDRLLGKADIALGLFYDVPSRRFFSNYDEYAMQYSWDMTDYDEPLDVPECLIIQKQREDISEVIGYVDDGE